MKSQKLNNQDSIRFIFAGNSTVTFLNTLTQNRFTFRVKAAKNSNVFYVSVLSGQEYFYIGTVLNGIFRKSPKITQNAQSVRVFSWVLTHLISGSLNPAIEIWHEGKCGKCGRPLTVPESITNGLGPMCAKKLAIS